MRGDRAAVCQLADLPVLRGLPAFFTIAALASVLGLSLDDLSARIAPAGGTSSQAS